MLRRTAANIPKALIPRVRGYRTWYDPRLPLPLVPRYKDSFFRLPEIFRDPLARDFDINWFDNKSMNDYFQTTEEKDKYVVNIKDANLADKNVKLDFNKNENSLKISIEQKMDQEDKGNTSSFASSFSSNYQFEKPVSVDSIVAEHGKDGLTISLPKLEVEKDDDDDVVNIKINRGENESESTPTENN
ncbi:uncharacterized protein SPAPADRAFT_63493 [Spathaspora passalidarum NRRL Y-27907]|uniref:SHSP domain-containing protein n=1 Tax=Spathaspora passalidarum (strain NRRL Y-27907 / 11-Y1) TaxID=619300 RepID=G3AV71_SPAPN|nr:uncharacterized protein SPAPADRAFT_63493 [Spathaspora passalidarum NRRL Y-27907]EGW29874.1 hypothetical protein SPAPADRAFT_63493 [Spathaspora passalidarum NRRL Y-27907]